MTQCPNKWGVGSDFHLMKKQILEAKLPIPGLFVVNALLVFYTTDIKNNFLRDWFVKLKIYQENYDPRQFAKIHIDVSWEALVKPCRLQVATL